MAATKNTDSDLVMKKMEKALDGNALGGRHGRTQKLKPSEHSLAQEKKQTRAKTRTAQSDEVLQPTVTSVNKARDKGKTVIEVTRDENLSGTKKDSDSFLPKRDELSVGKKDGEGILVRKIGEVSPMKKIGEVSPSKKMEVFPSKKSSEASLAKKIGEVSPTKRIGEVPPMKKIGEVAPMKKIGDVPLMKKIGEVLPTKKMDISLGKKIDLSAGKKIDISSGKKIGEVVPTKKAVDIGVNKRDVDFSHSKKDAESLLPKKDTDTILSKKDEQSAGKKDGEGLLVKSRKGKVRIAPLEKKKDDLRSGVSKMEEKSEVSTIEKHRIKDDKVKTERKEASNGIKPDGEKNNEIMNSDVTSSVEDKNSSKVMRNHSPSSGSVAKESGWNPGDLAWGRVGQHPFWPCIVAVDVLTGQFTKTKRVGRGLNSVQQSLHVQFFGDNGRHSWISTSCVIKYEGRENLQKFADKVLVEMKKKDKKFSSAFVVKPSSKPKWETAIREAEEAVPKSRDERMRFFEELLPKKKSNKEADHSAKSAVEEEAPKSSPPLKKMKRPSTNIDDKPLKQLKLEIEASIQKSTQDKMLENAADNSPTRKRRGRNKIMKKQIGVAGK